MRLLKATKENVRLAAEIIKKGGLVIYPTDTVYGVGCNPFNVDSVKRVFEVKGRTGKPMPVLAYSIENAKRIAEFNDKALKIAEAFWPGPITLILPKKPNLPDIVTCNHRTVGVRVPNHEVALELMRLSVGLLIGTSANKTGGEPPKTVEEAVRQIGEKVDIVLDGGRVPLGMPSTVVDLTVETPTVVREGPVKLNSILKVLRA
ncbi:threonylcarbamoyl-AMP synthase [Candidatus Bathyarchaeota archaeon]|nr:MAG: threonylcarbamoyl-AMP synthase [Candidatus Bathyarchaeota archaeon]